MPYNTILEKKKKTLITRSMHIILILAYGDDDKKIDFKLFRMYLISRFSSLNCPTGKNQPKSQILFHKKRPQKMFMYLQGFGQDLKSRQK